MSNPCLKLCDYCGCCRVIEKCFWCSEENWFFHEFFVDYYVVSFVVPAMHAENVMHHSSEDIIVISPRKRILRKIKIRFNDGTCRSNIHNNLESIGTSDYILKN